MSTAVATVSLVISVAAAVFALVALIMVTTGGTGSNGGSNNNGNTTILFPSLLSIYDNTAQPLAGRNLWTNVTFNNHLYGSSSWIHTVGSDEILCNRSDIYTVYFAIQIQLDPNLLLRRVKRFERGSGGGDDGDDRQHRRPDQDRDDRRHNHSDNTDRPECKACFSRYLIRATQQFNGTGNLNEIPGSLTYEGGNTLFASKNFFITAEAGDVFRFQFISLCDAFTLTPEPLLRSFPTTLPVDFFPSSAVLLIS